MAAEQTRNPTSDEAVAGTWTGSAGSRWSVVDDYPDTAGTDELTHGTATAGNLTFGFSAFSIPSTATNIQVFVDYYDYKNASQSCQFAGRLKVGATYYNASTHNPGNGSGNRTQRTDTWANNPAGGAWTPAQINGTAGSNNLVAFGYFSGDANPSITTSSIRLRVTYDNDYPLTADGGTFALTGNDATLTYTPNEAGQDYPIAADVGSFALTGVDAGLLVGRRLVADSGTLLETGNSAGLTSQRKLAADSGTFLETGRDAGLTAQRKLAADAGAFVLTGIDATLTYTPAGGYTLSADAGAFALTGNAAGLTSQRKLAASTGTFVETVNSAGLFAGRRVAADDGAFVETGNSAGLTVQRKLAANAGAFALTVRDANLTYTPTGSYSMAANAGAFALAGAEAELWADRRLVSDTGTCTLTGNAAGLLTGRAVAASTGAFTLTGNDVGFNEPPADYSLTADCGTFVLTGYAALLRGDHEEELPSPPPVIPQTLSFSGAFGRYVIEWRNGRRVVERVVYRAKKPS